MKVLKTSIDEVDGKVIYQAISVLADGGVVLYPTDTVYGLGANIFDNSVQRDAVICISSLFPGTRSR